MSEYFVSFRYVDLKFYLNRLFIITLLEAVLRFGLIHSQKNLGSLYDPQVSSGS